MPFLAKAHLSSSALEYHRSRCRLPGGPWIPTIRDPTQGSFHLNEWITSHQNSNPCMTKKVRKSLDTAVAAVPKWYSTRPHGRGLQGTFHSLVNHAAAGACSTKLPYPTKSSRTYHGRTIFSLTTTATQHQPEDQFGFQEKNQNTRGLVPCRGIKIEATLLLYNPPK